MPAEIDNGKQYTLGRGKLFFAAFTPNTTIKAGGRRYIGNSTAFTVTQAEDALDHYDSDEGFKVQDDSITLQNTTTGTLTTDNISSKNLALWYQGSEAQTVVAPGVGQTETITAGLDEWYALGESDALPQGVGTVANVTVKKGVTAVVALDNWEVDLTRGQIHVLPTAVDIEAGDELIVTFDVTGGEIDFVISSGLTLFGELYFQSTNPKGPVRDVLIPYVKITPNGDYNFKGDDWQAMTFALTVLLLPNRQRLYITRTS